MHPNSYEEYPVGSVVMGLYPDTSCFYRAEVVASPGMRVSIGWLGDDFWLTAIKVWGAVEESGYVSIKIRRRRRPSASCCGTFGC